MSYLGRSAKLSLKAQEKVSFLATAGQTSKTGLSYTPTFVEVYVNGVLLTDTTDFTATNGNSITFTVALLLNDEVTVISLKTFTVADHYNKTEADTLLAAKATNTAVALKAPIASPVFTGNVGIGVVPEAWSASWTSLDLGSKGSLSNNANFVSVGNNAYNNGVWRYKDTQFATDYHQENGTHAFRVAPSGSADAAISWNTAMTIDNTGNVGIGTGSELAPLSVASSDAVTMKLTKLNTPAATGNVGAAIEFNHSQNATDGADGESTSAIIKALPKSAWGGDLTFSTKSADGTPTNAPTERMRINSAGSVLVGTSGTISGFFPAKIQIDAAANNGIVVKTTTAGEVALGSWNSTAAGTRYHCSFYDSVSRTHRGSITTNGSTVTYGSNSDYRLKTNVTPMTGATAAVKLLKPCNFDWIDSGDNVNGFIAHELQAVVPEAATGTKDAMRDEEYEVTPATGDVFTAGSEAGFTEVSAAIVASPAYYDVDGNVIKAEVIAQAAVHEAYDEVAEIVHFSEVENPETLEEGQQWRETTAQVMGTRSVPDMQGIDQSKLVPLLTATIQELIARIETLEQGV